MIIEDQRKQQFIRMCDLKPGQSFIHNGNPYIVADIQQDFHNQDDQEETINYFATLAICPAGLIHEEWTLSVLDQKVELVEIKKIVIG